MSGLFYVYFCWTIKAELNFFSVLQCPEAPHQLLTSSYLLFCIYSSACSSLVLHFNKTAKLIKPGSAAWLQFEVAAQFLCLACKEEHTATLSPSNHHQPQLNKWPPPYRWPNHVPQKSKLAVLCWPTGTFSQYQQEELPNGHDTGPKEVHLLLMHLQVTGHQ